MGMESSGNLRSDDAGPSLPRCSLFVTSLLGVFVPFARRLALRSHFFPLLGGFVLLAGPRHDGWIGVVWV